MHRTVPRTPSLYIVGKFSLYCYLNLTSLDRHNNNNNIWEFIITDTKPSVTPIIKNIVYALILFHKQIYKNTRAMFNNFYIIIFRPWVNQQLNSTRYFGVNCFSSFFVRLFQTNINYNKHPFSQEEKAWKSEWEHWSYFIEYYQP